MPTPPEDLSRHAWFRLGLRFLREEMGQAEYGPVRFVVVYDLTGHGVTWVRPQEELKSPEPPPAGDPSFERFAPAPGGLPVVDMADLVGGGRTKAPPTKSDGDRAAEVLAAVEARHGRLGEMESAAVEVVFLSPGAFGPEVAEKTGYPYSTRLRNCLSGLVKRGILVNRRPGYRLAPAGFGPTR